MTDPNAQPEVLDDELNNTGEVVEVAEEVAEEPKSKVVDLDEEDANDEAFAKLDNKAFAKLRAEAASERKKREELEKRIQSFEPAAQQPREQYVQPQVNNVPREMIGGVPVPQTKAEWDALARQDWQLAVDMRSEIKARKIADEVQASNSVKVELDKAKEKVLKKHPELADARTEKGQIFLNILAKNPHYTNMANGPIYAMRDMEEQMEEMGFTREQIFDNKKYVANNEATRVSRTSLTSAGRMPAKDSRQVTLTKDELEMCQGQGIDPKDFAKQKLQLEANRRGAQL